MRCNVCGSTSRKFLFAKRDYKIWKCANCSFYFVYPIPTKKQLKNFYSNIMFKRGEKYQYKIVDNELIYSEKQNDVRKLKYVRKFIKSGKLLDVGCARGFFLFLTKNNFNVNGIEYSNSAVKIAKQLGLNVKEGEIFDIKNKNYDVITLWDVIEHVKNPDYLLKDVNHKLKRGKYLFLSTGDSDTLIPKISLKNWSLMTPPMHLHFFSNKTIKKILEKNGFQILELKYLGKVIELRWILFKIADITNIKLLKALYYKIQNSFIGKLKIKINTFDIMTICAKKIKEVK